MQRRAENGHEKEIFLAAAADGAGLSAGRCAADAADYRHIDRHTAQHDAGTGCHRCRDRTDDVEKHP